MTNDAIAQLTAVVVGGLLAVVGGFLSSTLLERRRNRQEARNLALAFKGEITAILELIRERGYLDRFTQVIDQIETTGEPFLMPFRIRFRYDRVYDQNVDRIGTLVPPLPEQITLFYTRLTSILEDMASLGDGTFADIDLPLLVRIYRDSRLGIQRTIEQGGAIIEAIDEKYPTDRPTA